MLCRIPKRAGLRTLPSRLKTEIANVRAIIDLGMILPLCRKSEGIQGDKKGVFVNERRWAYASDEAQQNPDYPIPVSLR